MYVDATWALVGGLLASFSFITRGIRDGERWTRTSALAVGALYAAWVVSITVLPIGLSMPETARVNPGFLEHSVNTVPFATIALYLKSDLGLVATTNLAGNLLLLAPLGLLAPIVIPWFARPLRILSLGFFTSVAIEGTQYLREFVNVTGVSRSVDVDDLILNTLGVLIGYALYRAVRGVRKHLEREPRRSGATHSLERQGMEP